ncbi:MAG TPA: pseudouridine synthase [Microbacteriaceae bacterium]|nr:pseudouridine synthase [Microbacteriaceae bacterium]
MNKKPFNEPQTEEMRLQKALAHAGVASRRASETLITSGRVTINGETVFELGTKIDPDKDTIRVDGVVVQLDVAKRYFVFNKPVGVLSTMSDDRGRKDLSSFVKHIEERVVNVGRLDQDTSGLLILTNDGELANQLAHPKYGVQKTYVAKVRGRVTGEVIRNLKNGLMLEDGLIKADHAKVLTAGSIKSHSLVEITLHSGRNRIVRRMLAHLGHPVEELVRRQFGPLNIGALKSGEIRELSAAERGALLTSATEGGALNKKVSAGRPGDGAGAKGMRGVAARGNPHGRGNHAGKGARAVTSKSTSVSNTKSQRGKRN